MANDFSNLFQSIKVGRCKKKLLLKNRLVMSPMITCTANSLGETTQRMVDYYVERAKGGVGMIIVESMDIDDKMLFNRLGIFHDRFINGLDYLTSSIKERGARVFGQINETGIRGDLPGPDDLSLNRINDLLEAYATAAERAKRAGFDGVEIHGGHGYLISQFLSPLTNHRTDRYGGDRDKRTKFAQEVVELVRKEVGNDFPIGFRMNGSDYLEGGITIEDARVTARKIEDAGADLIHVSAGVGIMAHDLSLGNTKSYFHMIQPMFLPRGCLVHLAATIKKIVKVPVITVGRINDPFLASDILTHRKADLLALGRQLSADPYFPKKVAAGEIDNIRQCIACNYCHGKRFRATKHLHCAINPWTGREAELKDIKRAETPKNIMIIGGGPAGMEAARWLKRRGHQPTIFEKSDRLGGQLLLAHLPPYKKEIYTFRKFLVKQIEKMGIDINLMTKVTPEYVLLKKPDILIVATGGRPLKPDLLSINKRMKCVNGWDVLINENSLSEEKIVVLGGGFVGAEISEFIAEKGKDVTLIEMRNLIAFDMEPLSRQMLIDRIKKLKIQIITKTLIQEITANGVKVKGTDDERVREFPADAVVIALGSEPVEFRVQEIEKAGIETYVIGDGKEISGIAKATRDAFVIGTTI